jgi:hypothetical protein
MFSDSDFWRAAKAMVQRYGSDAGIEVAQRADNHLAMGHVEISATWRCILSAIE